MRRIKYFCLAMEEIYKKKIIQQTGKKTYFNKRMLSKTHQPNRRNNFHHSTYYSKTQVNFYKAYSKQVQFITKLNDLFNAVDKRKVIKITEQVKLGNRSFRKYLNQRKIVHLKIQDVIGFEEMLQKTLNNQTTENSYQTSNSQIQDLKKMFLPPLNSSKKQKDSRKSTIVGTKNFSTLRNPKPEVYSPLQKQMIKKGFMSLLQKLETLKKDEFINQTGYLQGVLVRECNKLKSYGIEDDQDNKYLRKGRKINAKKMDLIEQIDHDQKLNGVYPMIMKSIREQTFAIQNAENTFSLLMQS